MRDSDTVEALLAPFLEGLDVRYTSAPWLAADFEADRWLFKRWPGFELDWNVRLDDGRSLCAPEHIDLCRTFKSWIVVQTDVDVTGGRLFSERSERYAIQFALHCIDYLLLNGKHLGLAKHGLRGLTNNDLKAMICSIAGQNTQLGIYEWPNRLTRYLRSQIEGDITRLVLDPRARDAYLSHPSDRLTQLTDAEILQSRTWLLNSGLYRGSGLGGLAPDLRAIARDIYKDTLYGMRTNLAAAPELELGLPDQHITEYARAKVTTGGGGTRNRGIAQQYVRTMETLSLLSDAGLPAPLVSGTELRAVVSNLPQAPVGRFRTIPFQVVHSSLKRALEFCLEYGEPLIASYLNVAKCANENGETIAGYCRSHEIGPLLDERTRALGVTRWSIFSVGPPTDETRISREQYYQSLRSNLGLFDAVSVLVGAIQVAVGALSARRMGELLDLQIGAWLDKEGTRLVFENRKSGFLDLRERIARPIPPVAVRLLRLLEDMQLGLIQMGLQEDPGHLLACPRRLAGPVKTPLTHGRRVMTRAVDLFCDWAEVPLDPDGRRYYIRQHQLRRFFALLFFYGSGFGGIDTLRWFLGHTDAQHVWHYITESTPGATLRHVAAQWAAYGVQHGSAEAELLAAEVAVHFGTSDFAVVDEEALVLYLEDLIEEGKLSITPQFLDGGSNYRIAVVLNSRVSDS